MTKPFERKTKIICTIGPVSSSYATIKKLAEAGMDVARLNFSHGDHSTHHRALKTIRKVSEDTGKQIGVLQDLGGPKIRLGVLSKPLVELKPGQRVTLFPGDFSQSDHIPVNYPYLLEDVTDGAKIMLADGLVELFVEKIKDNKLICHVVTGGELSSHKGVNLPLSKLRVPAFTDKDKIDLAFGLEEGVDFVALSFVRDSGDLEPVRRILNEQQNPPLLFAKIEKPQAIERLHDILSIVDGIMVARGDLGVEMPFEQLPIIQKRIIEASRKAGKPVITATQMLRSMIENPRPTRAEATDTANAILDGTDAVMLSDETAVGAYPVEAVMALDKIARACEGEIDRAKFFNEPESELVSPVKTAISRAACELSRILDAVCIVAPTVSGSTARLVAKYRPAASIIGFTSNQTAYRALSISWGVTPVLVERKLPLEDLCRLAIEFTKSNGLGKKGDRIILTAGYPYEYTSGTDMVKVITINGE